MGSIERYVFRTTLGAFLLVLASLTAIIWVTQALRNIDLMTTQGQNILVFIGITGLVIPQLVMIIGPVALMIAIAHVLNKLATDSEIIVMNSAGMSPWRLFRALFAAALVVALIVGFISAYLSPKCVRELRLWASQVRADLINNILLPGRFTPIERGLIFHIRERQPNGVMLGIFVDDQRDPNEQSTFLAEHGQIVENQRGTFLVMDNGTVQRHRLDQRDPTIVHFDRYAFDLSRYAGGPQELQYLVRELYLWQLAAPEPDDPVLQRDPGQFRAEFHDRIAAPLYPLAFAIIAFMYLGPPSTTRQSRTVAMVSAFLIMAVVRVAGFVSIIFGVNRPAALSLQYIVLLMVFWLGLTAISRGVVIRPPAAIVDVWTVLQERFMRRVAMS